MTVVYKGVSTSTSPRVEIIHSSENHCQKLRLGRCMHSKPSGNFTNFGGLRKNSRCELWLCSVLDICCACLDSLTKWMRGRLSLLPFRPHQNEVTGPDLPETEAGFRATCLDCQGVGFLAQFTLQTRFHRDVDHPVLITGWAQICKQVRRAIGLVFRQIRSGVGLGRSKGSRGKKEEIFRFRVPFLPSPYSKTNTNLRCWLSCLS